MPRSLKTCLLFALAGVPFYLSAAAYRANNRVLFYTMIVLLALVLRAAWEAWE